MGVTWDEASQITAGLVLSGRISKQSVRSDDFLSPYDKLIKEFQAGKQKEELILSVGLEPVHTALMSIENLNGTSEADWCKILETTSMYYDAGNKLGKFSDKLKRGEPIDWAMLNYYAKLAQQNQGKDFTPLSAVTESGVVYIKTGWKPWDEHLCGIPQVGLVVIGGMSYSGKTWSWIKLSSEFAKLHKDKNVAFFSLEMTLPELKERYDVGKLPVDVQDRLLLCPHPMNVESVIAKAATIENLGLVGIDYADLLVEDETTESAMTKIYRVLALGSKELNCPIILFAQLNGATGKLPRPQNLRWCLPATERVFDVDSGGWTSPSKLDKFKSLTFDGNFLTRQKAVCAINTPQEIVRIKTASGFTLRCSLDHPLFTENGKFTKTKDISRGDLVAVVKRTFVDNPIQYSPKKAKILGYMIGDGYMPARSKGGISWVEPDDELINDFRDCFESEFPNNRMTKRHHSRDNLWIMEFPKSDIHAKLVSDFALWLESLEMRGQKSYTFRIPQEAFKWDDISVANLIAGLFASDGTISKFGAKYYSKSEQLLLDIKLLLLRFGIMSRISKNTLSICSFDDVTRFRHYITIPGAKGRKLNELILKQSKTELFHDTSDVLPIKLTEFVRRLGKTNLTKKRRLTRSRFNKIMVELNAVVSVDLQPLCSDDIWWDKVVSVTPNGFEETYDISVDKYSNFVVEGFVTHNTRLAEAIGWSVLMTFNPNTDWRGGIVTETKLPKNRNCAYLLAYKMKGGFRNHIDDSPGAIEMPYRPNLGFGDKSRWYKIDTDD